MKPKVQEFDVKENSADKTVCVCGVRTIKIEKDLMKTFTCIHCGCNYHHVCMAKSRFSKNCSFCHLKLLTPCR